MENGCRLCQAELRCGVKYMTDFRDVQSSPGPPYREKRTVPRYPFIATMLLIEPNSDTKIPGRVSEISRKGCYVDVMNTLPVGTEIRLQVSRDQGQFSTPAKIIYVQEGIGMGVGFVDTHPDQLKILDSWLSELSS